LRKDLFSSGIGLGWVADLLKLEISNNLVPVGLFFFVELPLNLCFLLTIKKQRWKLPLS
jgi:hypothetical protein